MKELFLVRHADASGLSPSNQDVDRPLSERGEQDLARVAQKLNRLNLRPDFIVSSTATRALSTAKGIARGFGLPEESIHFLSKLYLASAKTILKVIRDLDEDIDSAVIVGHNPGLHHAVMDFSKKARAPEPDDFPTLGVVRLTLQVEFWALTEWNSAISLDWL